MSGKPLTSSTLDRAAVVIHPPRPRAVPRPVICTLAAAGCGCEPIRDERPAEARAPIKVPLSFHLDRQGTRFLEGCPANHAEIPLFAKPRAPALALWPPCPTYISIWSEPRCPCPTQRRRD